MGGLIPHSSKEAPLFFQLGGVPSDPVAVPDYFSLSFSRTSVQDRLAWGGVPERIPRRGSVKLRLLACGGFGVASFDDLPV